MSSFWVSSCCPSCGQEIKSNYVQDLVYSDSDYLTGEKELWGINRYCNQKCLDDKSRREKELLNKRIESFNTNKKFDGITDYEFLGGMEKIQQEVVGKFGQYDPNDIRTIIDVMLDGQEVK